MRCPHLLLVSVFLAGCLDSGGAPAGIALTPLGDGPEVVFDWEAKPLPDLPFPTDLATWTDTASPTGLRVNVSLVAPTGLERVVRDNVQAVTGFGTYAPITVSFDHPIDAARVRTLHDDDDPDNDAIWIVNVDRDSPAYGEFVPLDLGQGYVPIALEKRDRYFDGDNRAATTNLLYDTVSEDLDGDGLLDPARDTDGDGVLDVSAEDTDGDGVLDRGNMWPAGGDPVDDLLTFYDTETNTLVIRVQRPMAQRSRYAVVITRRVVDLAGEPVRSPFPYVNHARQTRVLEPLADLLDEVGGSLDDVAFAWTFTTQDVTGDLEALRAGLYGHGVFASLASRYAPDLDLFRLVDEGKEEAMAGTPYALRVEAVSSLLGFVAQEELGIDGEALDALKGVLRYAEFVVGGSFSTPDMLFDRDGIASEGRPADEDESWNVDAATGKLEEQPGRVPFFCVVPKPFGDRQPPFPVAFFAHGYGSNRLEMLTYAGNIARFGFAVCSIDAPAHGMPDLNEEQRGMAYGLTEQLGITGLADVIVDGRARDLDNDGEVDGGGDYWTANVFHTRDMVRQASFDYMRFIQILRSFDGRAGSADLDGDGDNDVAGDFTGDGKVEFGGPEAEFFMTGGSLGGILSGVLAGVEPAFVAAAPVVGGAGLSDIAIRSTQTGVPEAAILLMMGSLVMIRPPESDNSRRLEFIVPKVAKEAYLHFATLTADEVKPGDWLEVEVKHAETGGRDVRYVPIPVDGAATRVHIAADALGVSERAALLGLPVKHEEGYEVPEVPAGVLLGDELIVRIRAGGELEPGEVRREVKTFEHPITFMGATWPEGAKLVAPAGGFGHRRATPDFRRFFSIAAALLEPGDPIGYAPHYSLDPLPADYDTAARPGAHVLHVPTIGDMNVPVNTGIAMARASGALSAAEHRILIDNYVVEGVENLERWKDGAGAGVLLDPDNLSEGTDGFDVPRLAEPLRATHEDALGGESGLRLPYASPRGSHGFGEPDPTKAFNVGNYSIQMIGRYFQLRGQKGAIVDDRCLADDTCDFIVPPPD